MKLHASAACLAAALVVVTCLAPGQASAVPLPPDAGLQLWLRADTGVGLSGSEVTAWADQSGEGNDALAPAAANRPDFVASAPGLNGSPTLRFDGSSDYLRIDSRILPDNIDEMTVFSVARADTDNNASIVGIRSASRPLIQLDQQGGGAPNLGKARFIVGNSAATVNSLDGIHTGSYGIYSGQLTKSGSASTATVAFGGEPGAPATGSFGTGALASGEQRIGSVTDGGHNYYWDGDIAEVLIYDRALTGAEQNRVGYYLESKYGTSWSPVLPTDGLELWLRADAGVTTDAGGQVTRWDDQSGSSGSPRYAVPDTGAGASGPQFVAGVPELNDRPAMRFNGADEAMGIVNRILASDVDEFTIFAVARSDKDSNASILGLRSNQPFIQLDQQGGSPPNLGKARLIVRDSSGTTANALGEIHTGDYGIYAGVLSYDDLTGISDALVYFDGVLEGSASATFNGPFSFGAVTQRVGGTVGTYYWDGDIAEILVFDRMLTPAELDQVTGYLGLKYDLDVSFLIPEPTTAALLVLGALVGAARRRRR